MKANYKTPLKDYIPLEALRRMLERMKDMPDDTPITFEFICTAFFPTIFNNVQEKINEAYTQGYMDCKNKE